MNELNALGIYIHIPFCIRKCKYCDFLSFVSDEETMERYVDSLCQEIKAFFEREKNYQVTTIYLGGGTPSILKPELTKMILDTVFSHGNVHPQAEISTEANPGTLTKEKLLIYKETGINRLSIGLQSTEQKELSYLGRIHSYEDFVKGYEMAVSCGFTNINIDLMSAVPYQTLASWERSLERVLALNPAHISAYSLIVEEGTPFYEDDQLDELIPDEDTERRMYEVTEEKLLEHGYHRYEISNYAKAGQECAHNLVYWNREDYIGFGLGAASCIRNQRFRNTDVMDDYLKNPFVEFESREEYEVLPLEEQMAEEMILGLRMTAGISKKSFYDKYGREMDEVYGEILHRFVNDGLMEEAGEFIRFTKKGLDLSNIVLREFV